MTTSDNKDICVLAVDDEPGIRKVVETFLARNGYQVLTASDGAEACEVVENNKIDIVVSDYMMPNKDGMELLSHIRRSHHPEIESIFFIMLTAKSSEDDRLHGFQEGVDDYLSKPIQTKELLCRVNVGARIKRLQKGLVEANEQKDKALGIIAHDLRNPIGVIRGVAELFSAGLLGEMTKDGKKFIDSISYQTNGMLHMIDDLLDITKIEAGKIDLVPQPFRVNDIVGKIWGTAEMQANHKGIKLEFDDSGPLLVYGDLGRAETVLANFVSNAIKYSNEGDHISVMTEAQGDNVKILVEDTGLGIPASEQGLLFTKFSKISTRPTGGESSSGLGLAICKKLVDIMGGEIGAESEEGKGSRFWFTLPKYDEKPEAAG